VTRAQVHERGNGEGTLYQRSDGRWVAAVTLPDGGRKTKYARTRAKAAEELLKLQHNVLIGGPSVTNDPTFGDLADEYLKSVTNAIKSSTWRRYEQLIRLHLTPYLGKTKLVRIGPQHLESLYVQLETNGLGRQTIVHVHRVAHAMFSKALRWGYTHRNPVSVASPPRIEHKEMRTLSVEEVSRLLDKASGTRYEALWRLAIGSGLRLGEMLALRWQDVDLDQALARIRHTLERSPKGLNLTEPKTSKSRRTISLSPSVELALRNHQSQQLKDRLLLGAEWQDLDFVFTGETGGPVNPNNIGRRVFKPLLRSANIDDSVRIHDLRHTAISLALSAGVAPTDVADMAGHGSVAVTLTQYAHALPDAPKRATDAIENLLVGL
jgi:integrase